MKKTSSFTPEKTDLIEKPLRWVSEIVAATGRSVVLGMALLLGTTVAALGQTIAVPDGYATQNGGTTGGGNATPIIVSTAADFRTAVGHNSPAVVVVNGRLDVGDVRIGSNKTIVGADTNAGLYGGTIGIQGTNYILQNLIIGPVTEGDALEISGARNVFITKCEFYGSLDELCSIVRQADFVTVSWSKFHFPNSNQHSFAHLIGNADEAVADRGKLHVTLHHNWYAEGVAGRMPRVRFGKVHIYNNFFNAVDSGYCIGIGLEASIRVENTHFESVSTPWADNAGIVSGAFGWKNLKFVNCTQPTFMPNTYPVFEVPYAYVMDPVESVKSIVTAGAGNRPLSPTNPPVSPVELYATAGNARTFLNWVSSRGATSYNVQRATVSGGPYTPVGSSSSNSYTDGAVANDTTYYYVVSAADAGGESPVSPEAGVTPNLLAESPPSAPAGFTANPGNTQVSLSWSAASTATSYNVKRSSISGGPYSKIASPTGTNYTNTGLTNGATYYYVVSAVNANGESANSAEVSATLQHFVPPAPATLSAVGGNRQVSLSWAAAATAASYNVKRATTSDGPYTTIASANTTTYTNTGLTNGTAYYYVVSAVNVAGESGNSPQAFATPLPPIDPSAGLKVDINHSSRNQPAQTETGYTMWSTIQPSGNPGTTSAGLTPISQTLTMGNGNVVTVSFEQTALSQTRGGTGIASHWFQVGAQGATKLVSDGIMVAPTNLDKGGELLMKISGLSAGTHSVLTYHNGVDNPASGNAYGPLDISLNGVKVFNKLAQSIRAPSNLLAATAYFEFTVSGPQDVVTILFSADPTAAGFNRRTPVINGFEIDIPNTIRMAGDPSPMHEAEQIETSINLNWSAALAGNAVSHDVYVGTDPVTVKSADRTSPEFKGNQTTRSFPLASLTHATTYYWRIDEKDALGNATKGEVWQFRTAEDSAGQSYADWTVASGLPAGSQAPSDDPDGDGVANQIEFILGLTPVAPDSSGLPKATLSNDWFTFRFTRSTVVDGSFTVERSVDLQAWSAVATTVASSTATTETLVAQLPRIPGKQFVRLTSESVSTVPLGYLDTNLAAGNTAFGLLFDDISATPPGIRAGRIETVATNTIGVSGANWVSGLADPTAPWAVRFASGAADGRLVDITASSANTLTLGGVNLTALGVVPGDRFELVALDTLGTLFGADTLQGGTSAANADVVQLRSGATWIAYYFDTTLGFWRRTSGAAVNSNNTVVRPGSGILIMRRGAPLGLTISGQVLGSSFRQPVNNASTTAITAGFPTDTTLGALAVQTLLPGWRSGTVASQTDAVGLYSGTAWVPYYFNGVNWQTAGGVNANSVALPAGSALLIQRPGFTAGTTDLVRAKVY